MTTLPIRQLPCIGLSGIQNTLIVSTSPQRVLFLDVLAQLPARKITKKFGPIPAQVDDIVNVRS